MKKYTILSYIVLILIIVLSGFFICKISKKNTSDEDIKEKTLSEVKHLENEFQNLFNQFKNINFENYKITTIEIEENNLSNSNQNSESSKENLEKNEEQENIEDKESSEDKENSSSIEKNEKYKIERTSVLLGDEEINWKQIKNDIEKIYAYINPMTFDLYQILKNTQDIADFNKEYDELTKLVKEEKKEECLKQLTVLYDYFPKFIENCTENDKDKIIAETKKYIFKSYSVLDNEEWDVISDNIDKAMETYKKFVISNENKENVNQYNVDKTYIMISELKNSVALKDKDVFLIKYKNLLEELQNI